LIADGKTWQAMAKNWQSLVKSGNTSGHALLFWGHILRADQVGIEVRDTTDQALSSQFE
jgi:hypothetical protein